MQRLSDVAPDSVVRDQYEQGFAPGFNIASGFENPDQAVEDLREMTYTAFVDIDEADIDYTDARPLDDRLSAIEVPLLVIFGAEDQIYDAEAAIAPYEDIEGVQTELIEGVGHSPNVEAPGADRGPDRGLHRQDRGRRARRAPRRGRKAGEKARGAAGPPGRRPGRRRRPEGGEGRKAGRPSRRTSAEQAEKPEQAETARRNRARDALVPAPNPSLENERARLPGPFVMNSASALRLPLCSMEPPYRA